MDQFASLGMISSKTSCSLYNKAHWNIKKHTVGKMKKLRNIRQVNVDMFIYLIGRWKQKYGNLF